MRALLSLHHELLLSIYSREKEKAKQGMSDAKVFVCSKDKLSQMLHFGTDKFFGRDIEILLVRDEYQRDSVEECCLALTMASAVILVGDKNQAPVAVQQPIKAPTPLAPWLRHEKMNRFTAIDTVWTTQRFGGPILECIRASLSHMSSLRSFVGDTCQVFPLLLRSGRHWFYETEECLGPEKNLLFARREALFFRAVLHVAFVEVGLRWFLSAPARDRDTLYIFTMNNVLQDKIQDVVEESFA